MNDDQSVLEAVPKLLEKILEGESSILNRLRNQLSRLEVVSREVDFERCRIEFTVSKDSHEFLNGPEAFMTITDTYFKIAGNESLLYANLTINEGKINALEIGGSFDFHREFEISEIGWYLTNFENGGERILVQTSNDRDLNYAIRYIPMYK